MVIDSSALVALLLGEPEAQRIALAVSDDPRRLVGAFTVFEAHAVTVAKKGESGGRELDLLLHKCQIETVSMNSDQVAVARRAWLSYGKGRHRAGLNLGDCCSYALAMYSGEPLLFKGDDFGHTDITAVDC